MEYVFPFDNEEIIYDKSNNNFTLKKINKQFVGLFNLGVYNYNNNQFMCEFFNKLSELFILCECRPLYVHENLKDIILCFNGSFDALDKSFFVKISILAQKNPYHYVYGMLFYDLNSRKFTSCCSNEAMEYIYQYLLNNEHYKFLCKNLPKELVFELFKY